MTLSEKQIRQIARFYGVAFDYRIAEASGYRNTSHMFRAKSGADYNFIAYKDEPEITQLIASVHRLSTHLASSLLPVRSPVDERIIGIQTPSGTRYGGLYNYLSGHTIAWEMYSMKHIKLLGQAAGLIHVALTDYSDNKLPLIADITKWQLRIMNEYYSQAGVTSAMRDKLGIGLAPSTLAITKRATEAALLSGRSQVLHLDLVRGNVLFGEADEKSLLSIDMLAITGLIDFEKAAMGPVVFDLARTLSFLYVDCDKPEDKIKKYFLESGYSKRAQQPIAATTRSSLESLVSYYLLYDLYKFLSQNPYESLLDNHHYRRTKAILMRRQLLY